MNQLIYLDVETTGLDPDTAQIWEIGYAVDDGDVISQVVDHSLLGATEEALVVSRHDSRCTRNHTGSRAGTPLASVRGALLSLQFEEHLYRAVLPGNTIVGANPAFATKMLQRRWRIEPWHYRLIDVESYAMPIFGWDRPRSLLAICDQLGLPEPDHTAGGDVTLVRSAYRSLRTFAEMARS